MYVRKHKTVESTDVRSRTKLTCNDYLPSIFLPQTNVIGCGLCSKAESLRAVRTAHCKQVAGWSGLVEGVSLDAN